MSYGLEANAIYRLAGISKLADHFEAQGLTECQVLDHMASVLCEEHEHLDYDEELARLILQRSLGLLRVKGPDGRP
jgi:hypothetical protein